jgi:hypothetical protein
MRRWLIFTLLVVATALATSSPSFAAPPPNDDRANAASIPTFPATLTGTTVEATVERLDPQVSQCGRIDATSWYTITQSPDGTIVLGLQGATLAPVIRVYRLRANGIGELDCANAAAGRRAQIAFESVRGATFLVVVGKKPNTADSDYSLDAQLFLPPTNDSQRNAEPLKSLPATVKSSTLGATTDTGDPKGCGLAGGTVWYSVTPGSAARLVVRLNAQGDLDATVVIRERIRSQFDDVACAKTDKKGNAVAAVDVEKGAQYAIAVGQRAGSSPGDFTLEALAAQAAERAPGVRLSGTGVRSSVNGLTDVNDIWWKTLTPGTTYRIAFSSRGCAEVSVRSLKRPTDRLGYLECSGYTTFTPGPDGGGRYTFEVVAPRTTESQPYKLQISPAGADDLGVGSGLPNLGRVSGRLDPLGVDVTDVYHFDVDRTADVRLDLTQSGASQFSLVLVTDSGAHVTSGETRIHRNLQPGRYVVAVRGTPGTRGGRYSLALVIRGLTSTSLTASSASVSPGSSVTLSAQTSPTPDGGITEIEIDRFDPLSGWQFARLIRVGGSGGSVSWTPPDQGRWRARASFLGTRRFSPSRSSYAFVLVEERG